MKKIYKKYFNKIIIKFINNILIFQIMYQLILQNKESICFLKID
jgi:hypothetical protein